MIDPAASLLLQAARITSKPNPVAGMQALKCDEDFWDRTIKFARALGMSLILYRYLKTTMSNSVPTQVLNSLKCQLDFNLKENLRKTAELINLLRSLSTIGVEPIPYKGPTLATLAYGDLSMREFGDLDLLIEQHDYYKSQPLLISQNYLPEITLSESEAEGYCATTNCMAFYNEEKDMTVELHWELSPAYLPFSPDRDQLYRRLIAAYPGGRAIKTLSIEDLLLYLCVHGAKHAWERLIWIVDVGGLVHRHPEMDWDWVLRLASEQRVERELLLGLNLARDLTGIEFPTELFKPDSHIPALSRKVMSWMFSSEANSKSLVAQSLFLIQLRKGLIDKLRTIFNIIANPSVADWMAFRLPSRMAFLYPFLRPFRLLVKVAQTVGMRLF